jgi:hypothetical protein
VPMLAVRYGERALPLAWRVEETGGRSGSRSRRRCWRPLRPGYRRRRKSGSWAIASMARPI